ncbi:hypothetical protein BJF77_12000 [Kocuria sp. CNJ-770]|nr:hypothetical protein BJF77_12000 [Kocuria sp. CNJ-770]
MTLWQHHGIDVEATLSIGAYWEPGKGHTYTLDVTDRNREYTLEDLKTAYSEFGQFIRRAEQLEGGAL